MDQRRSVRHRVLERDHGRQGFEVGLDQLQGVLGAVPGVGHHHRDDLTDEPNAIDRNDRTVRRDGSRRGEMDSHRSARALQLRGGEDCSHAGRLTSGGGVDAADARARVRAAEHRDVEETLGLQVIDEPSLAAQERPVLQARQCRPDRTDFNASRLVSQSLDSPVN